MGIGREIGEQVRHWVGSGELINLPPQALANRLIDAAGPSRRLHGPLQDLGRQPLFLQLLQQQQPAALGMQDVFASKSLSLCTAP